MSTSQTRTYLTKTEELKTFVVNCLQKVGVSSEHAQTTAEALVHLDCVGKPNRGLNSVETLLSDIENGVVNPNARPRVLKQQDSTAWVDGKDGLGPVVATFCMELAIQKATRSGLCIVAATHSNDFGSGCVYTNMAAKSGLLGFAFSNGSCDLIPSAGKECLLGNNAIAMSAQGSDGDSVTLDMSLGTISRPRLNATSTLAENLVLDVNRQPTTNPKNAEYILPIGSHQEIGHKGFYLSFMMDVLSGLLSGSNYGPYINHGEERDSPPNMGQCFIALNPGCFAPGFDRHLTDLLRMLRRTEVLEEDKSVIVPGDTQKECLEKVVEEGGVRLTEEQVTMANKIAKAIDVPPLVVEIFTNLNK